MVSYCTQAGVSKIVGLDRGILPEARRFADQTPVLGSWNRNATTESSASMRCIALLISERRAGISRGAELLGQLAELRPLIPDVPFLSGIDVGVARFGMTDDRHVELRFAKHLAEPLGPLVDLDVGANSNLAEHGLDDLTRPAGVGEGRQDELRLKTVRVTGFGEQLLRLSHIVGDRPVRST